VLIEKQREDYEKLRDRLTRSEADWLNEKRLLEDEVYRYKTELRALSHSNEKRQQSYRRDREYLEYAQDTGAKVG